jgi:hypothetical protein
MVDAHIAIADALSFSAKRSATDPGPRARGVEPKMPAIDSSMRWILKDQ